MNERKSGSSSLLKSKKASGEISIIDSEKLGKLKRVKSIGRGATSEVFMVSREERFALKVYYPDALIVTNTDSDSDSNDDDDDAKEEKEKPVISADNARRFLLEYESINGLDHPNIIKAYGISLGDRILLYTYRTHTVHRI